MESKLERDVRFLKLYAVASTVICLALVTAAFRQPSERPKFEEIDVERINIVEKDGRLRMVLSNEARQHPGIVNGKVIPRNGPRPPGILFFDQRGDEMGGLIFGENGGDGHFGSFTFDKVRNDQTIAFRHLEGDDGSYETGLAMWQQPDVPYDVVNAKIEAARGLADEAERKTALQALRDSHELTTPRLFLGKRRDDATALEMSDLDGRARFRIVVPPSGDPRLEFLDSAGSVVLNLP